MIEQTSFTSVPLCEDHHTNYLDCGVERLDRWLDKHALEEQNLGRSRTHVWVDEGDIVVGYYTLLQTTISEEPDEPGLLQRLRPPKYPKSAAVPGILIGKLALDRSLQGQGLGMELLADAYLNAYDAVLLVGGVYLVIEPANGEEKLRALYDEFGFESIEGSSRMFLSFEEFNKGTPIDY